MRTSETRILTTHAGSLPRPAELAGLHGRRSRGEAVAAEDLRLAVAAATRTSIEAQVRAGVDIGNSGEQGRESFFTYVSHRMTGFSGTSERRLMADLRDYPDYLELALPLRQRGQVNLMKAPAATGPIAYGDLAELEDECRLMVEAPFLETFVTAASPGIVVSAMENRYFAGRPDYVHAVAAALATEYRVITERGFLLQVDAPDLALERHTLFADQPLDEFLAWVELVVGAINAALAGIDPSRVRLHVCWGNYEGPHTRDVALAELLPYLYTVNAGALVLPMANARHAHEHRSLLAQPIPEHMVLVAGVIDTTSNYVEHPEVVAERLERLAAAVGDPSRLIAGTDCGFETSAGIGTVAPSLVWEKLRSLAEGAAIASSRLF